MVSVSYPVISSRCHNYRLDHIYLFTAFLKPDRIQEVVEDSIFLGLESGFFPLDKFVDDLVITIQYYKLIT